MTVNSFSTRRTIDIPLASIPAIFGYVDGLKSDLVPYLEDLTTAERRTLPKVGPKTVDFVDKALVYAVAHPEFLPPFVNLPEFQRSVACGETLRKLREAVQMIGKALDDSFMLNNSGSLAAALSFYNAVKQAAKLKQYGAEAIADDLSARFPGRPTKAAVAARKAARKASGPDATA